MRLKHLILHCALLLVLGCGAGAAAQTFNLVSGRERVVSLAGLWRFHTGDNPEWAQPKFDDSQWPLVRSDESWTEQGYPAFNGYAWYRFKVEIPGDGRPVALLMGEVVNGFQMYADGRLIGSGGSAEATWNPRFASRFDLIAIPGRGSGPRTVTIALRVWTFEPIAVWVGSGSVSGNNWAGDPLLLRSRQQWLQLERDHYYVNEYAYSLFTGLLGAAILTLFLYRPSDKEYLWFALLLLTNTVGGSVHLWMNLGEMPFTTWRVIETTSRAIGMIATLSFFAVVLGERRTTTWWFLVTLVAIGPLTTVLILQQWTSMGVAYGIDEMCSLPAYGWIIARLLLGALRKDFSAQLLLVPVTLQYGSELIGISARIAWQLNLIKQGALHLDFVVVGKPFEIDSGDVISILFLLALLVFLMRRFSLARKEEERLAGEMEAARTIQALLVPSDGHRTPGFTVESIYLPAQEVGGDFFQVLPGDDGSLLLVIGDVSGKGLKAAMTVSAAMGALRGCTLRAPGAVLEYLNRTLCGQVSGFVTCCAALLTKDGVLTVANAGHLAPYCNGEELAVENGLPLGIAEHVTYAEKRAVLRANDRLTFISDGIVEARDKTGALFGFERTREMSKDPAERIAGAAQRFGQEDDITVLTVERAPAGATA